MNGTEPSSDHWCSLFIPPTFPWRIYSPGLLYDYLISPTSNISLFISINDDIPYLTERAESTEKDFYKSVPKSTNLLELLSAFPSLWLHVEQTSLHSPV